MRGHRLHRSNVILAYDLEEGPAQPRDADVAKAIVLAEVARIVADGNAVFSTLETGTIELRFSTGEIFHLGEEMVTRIA
jgi:hypothetical protein